MTLTGTGQGGILRRVSLIASGILGLAWAWGGRSSPAAPQPVPTVSGVPAGAFHQSPPPKQSAPVAPQASERLTPAGYHRPEEQTFLTFPEWYLVYSPEEYARYTATRGPSEFPFVGHLRQFVEGYRYAYQATRERYPFNADYHLMCTIIGVSTAVEYTTRSAYEATVGRLTEASCGHRLTAEERYAAQVARRYAGFLDDHAWYEFDFRGALRGLYTETPAWGPDMLRKWERRYALTTEYLFKGIYGGLMTAAARASYAPEPSVTAVVLTHSHPARLREVPGLEVLNSLPHERILALAPRYAAFMGVATQLAQQGADFEEIAGNRDQIALSVRAPRYTYTRRDDPRVRLVQPTLTEPDTERAVLVIPVAQLASTLRSLAHSPIRLEHIYDY